MDNLSGKNLGRYHIVEQLGEGGMASVYKAYDTRLERYVAVKVIRLEKDEDSSFLKRFEREAKALAKLSHPNIVHVNDYGDQDGTPYVVMDYIPGGTLKQKLGQPLPYQEAARLLAPVARALDHAHRNGIVHRDVKPANILLTANAEPMLSDFGIAKMLESEQTSELTGTGVGIGTPEYMAPEQGSGTKIDERADIYALGVVFYELITGRKPFKADTPMAVVVKHITEPLPRPSGFVPGLPDQVEQIIFKALAKKPEDRYQNMEQFAAVLEKLAQIPIPAASETVIAPQYGVPPSVQPKARKTMSTMSIVLISAVVLVTLVFTMICIFGFAFNYNNLIKGKSTPTDEAAVQQSTDILSVSTSDAAFETPRPKVTPKKTGTAGSVTGVVILAQKMGSLKAGGKVNLGSATVPDGLNMVMVSYSWNEGTAEPIVYKPDGSILNVKSGNGQDIFVVSSANMVGYNIMNPEPGKWSFVLQDAQPAQDTLDYVFSVSYPEIK